MLDHEKKLRKYMNRSKTGCELALDPKFGKAGVLEVDNATTINSLVVDAAGNLYATGEKTRKLVGSTFVETCSGFLRAQPTSKTMLLDDGLWSGKGCERTSISFKGFDRPARAIGFVGDDILVRGFDKEGTKDVEKLGVHGTDGAQKVKVGKSKGEEALSDLALATSCGDDLCAFGVGMHDVLVSRYTHAGAFIARRAVPFWNMRETSFATAGADTFVYGAVQADKTAKKDDYANVVLLVRNKPAESALRGKLRGLDFFPRSVKLDHNRGSWRVEVENERRSSVSTRLLVKPLAGAISIATPADKASGNAFLSSDDVFEPELKKKHMSSDVAGSVREHRIEITRWDVRPYDKAKGSHQELGYASGKIFIDLPYEPKDRPAEHSLVTGEFEDAIVSAWDDPEAPAK